MAIAATGVLVTIPFGSASGEMPASLNGSRSKRKFVKAYSLKMKAEKHEADSDQKAKGKIYRYFKRGLRGYWKRELRKLEDK